MNWSWILRDIGKNLDLQILRRFLDLFNELLFVILGDITIGLIVVLCHAGEGKGLKLDN